jgi:hypothetical protein
MVSCGITELQSLDDISYLRKTLASKQYWSHIQQFSQISVFPTIFKHTLHCISKFKHQIDRIPVLVPHKLNIARFHRNYQIAITQLLDVRSILFTIWNVNKQ